MSALRHANLSAGSPKDSVSELFDALAEAIKQRRGHKALGLVKLLRKHPAYGPAHVQLVARAYEIRLSEMHAVGQHKDAAGLLQMLTEQQPEVAALLSRRPALLLELEGGTGPLLARYGQDAALTEELDAWVRTECRDPRPLARHPGLDETHPLRAGALAVLKAWEEVDCGRVAEAYARLPDAIGRRSPFIAWRLFVQALKAAAAGSDKEACTCLARIAEDSAVRPLAEMLGRILADEPPQTVRESALRARIVAPSLYGALQEIDRHLSAGRLTEAQQHFEELLSRPIWSGRPQLLNELSARFMDAANRLLEMRAASFDLLEQPQDFLLPRLRRMPQFTQSFAKCMYWNNSDTVEDWEKLMAVGHPTPLLKALIYDRLAAIELLTYEDEEDDTDEECETESYSRALAYWRQSVRSFPLRETYVHWHDEARCRKADVEEVLGAWGRAFPEDEVPLLELTALYRANRTPQKALAQFRRLESVARGRPEVEALRPLLCFDSAAGRLSRGMVEAAEKDLAAVGPDIPDFARVVRATLRWVCALRGGKSAAEWREEWSGHPIWAFQTVTLLDRQWRMDIAAETAEILKSMVSQLRDDPARLVADYAQLARLSDAVWSINRWFPCGPPVEAAFRSRAADAADLWTITERLCTAEMLTMLSARDLCWSLTGNGLARRDMRTPEYLACRAMLYDPCLAPPGVGLHEDKALKHMDECMAVALRLARSSGRLEAVQMVEAISEDRRCCVGAIQEARLTDAACTRMLERESAICSWNDVPAALKRVVSLNENISDLINRLNRKIGKSRRSRSTKNPSGPDINQTELW